MKLTIKTILLCIFILILPIHTSAVTWGHGLIEAYEMMINNDPVDDIIPIIDSSAITISKAKYTNLGTGLSLDLSRAAIMALMCEERKGYSLSEGSANVYNRWKQNINQSYLDITRLMCVPPSASFMLRNEFTDLCTPNELEQYGLYILKEFVRGGDEVATLILNFDSLNLSDIASSINSNTYYYDASVFEPENWHLAFQLAILAAKVKQTSSDEDLADNVEQAILDHNIKPKVSPRWNSAAMYIIQYYNYNGINNDKMEELRKLFYSMDINLSGEIVGDRKIANHLKSAMATSETLPTLNNMIQSTINNLSSSNIPKILKSEYLMEITVASMALSIRYGIDLETAITTLNDHISIAGIEQEIKRNMLYNFCLFSPNGNMVNQKFNEFSINDVSDIENVKREIMSMSGETEGILNLIDNIETISKQDFITSYTLSSNYLYKLACICFANKKIYEEDPLLNIGSELDSLFTSAGMDYSEENKEILSYPLLSKTAFDTNHWARSILYWLDIPESKMQEWPISEI